MSPFNPPPQKKYSESKSEIVCLNDCDELKSTEVNWVDEIYLVLNYTKSSHLHSIILCITSSL